MTPQEEQLFKDQFVDHHPHARRGLKAATGHVQFYALNLTVMQGNEIRRAWVNKINEIAERYANSRLFGDYISDVHELQNYMNHSFPNAFHEGSFTFARAQKSLSVVLKFKWCHGDITMPPSCPIDKGILDRLGQPYNTWNWTEISENQFLSAYIELHRVATISGNSAAQQELLWYH